MSSPDLPDSTGRSDRVEVHVDAPFGRLTSVDLVQRAAEAALDHEQVSGPDRVTVLIAGDEKIRDLNRRFKGEDEVTDVLSFSGVESLSEGARAESEVDMDWPEEPGEADRLGDIVISLPQVERQADAAGKPFEHELAMLTVHGVLHLLGYDHAEPEEERVMFGKTDEILKKVFGERQ